jgi:hypothetical protein
MQVDRALAVAMIDKANNSLHTSRHDDGRTGRRAVVSHETSGRLAWVNLRREGLDVELVEPDFLVGDGVEDLPAREQLALI